MAFLTTDDDVIMIEKLLAVHCAGSLLRPQHRHSVLVFSIFGNKISLCERHLRIAEINFSGVYIVP